MFIPDSRIWNGGEALKDFHVRVLIGGPAGTLHRLAAFPQVCLERSMKSTRARYVYILGVVLVLGLVGGTIATTVTNFGRPDKTDFDPVVP
jgi:hypothetical protein